MGAVMYAFRLGLGPESRFGLASGRLGVDRGGVVGLGIALWPRGGEMNLVTGAPKAELALVEGGDVPDSDGLRRRCVLRGIFECALRFAIVGEAVSGGGGDMVATNAAWPAEVVDADADASAAKSLRALRWPRPPSWPPCLPLTLSNDGATPRYQAVGDEGDSPWFLSPRSCRKLPGL